MLEKLQKSKYCGEVPATKLAALQKVLQSEFLNAVREVSPDGVGMWRWWHVDDEGPLTVVSLWWTVRWC